MQSLSNKCDVVIYFYITINVNSFFLFFCFLYSWFSYGEGAIFGAKNQVHSNGKHYNRHSLMWWRRPKMKQMKILCHN